MKPLLFRQSLVLGRNKSIAICCLWSDKTEVKRLLSPQDYALIGNLYSPQGINLLVRNLLKKPQIRFLVLAGNDRNKTGLCVKHLFEKGLDSSNTIIGTAVKLDEHITADDIAFLSLRVKLVDLMNQQLGNLPDEIARLDPVPIMDQFLLPREVDLPALKESPYKSNDEKGFFTVRIEDCRTVCMGKTCFSCIKPSWGWKEIVIEHYSKNGVKTEAFVRGNKAQSVWKEVKKLGLFSFPGHEEYLENEVQRAFEALSQGKPFIQPPAILHN